MTLTNRVAIITGASSGIGAATARELDRAGMRILLTARRQEKLAQLAQELKQSIVVAADITDPRLPGRLIETAVQELGGCDALINNAGLLATGRIGEIDLERVSQMVRVNVEACFRVAYTALRHFLRQGSGHLVNTSSILGSKTRPLAGAYAGTKHAVEALSEALRLEVAGTGVRVSCVEPGMVMTGLHDHLEVHPARSMGIEHPLAPEDVARAIRYLLEQPPGVQVAQLVILPSDSPV